LRIIGDFARTANDGGSVECWHDLLACWSCIL
jgi:hypothetical protein